MATIIRSAKSGSAWTDNELLAYNIRVLELPAAAFFGVIPNANAAGVIDPNFLVHVAGQPMAHMALPTQDLLARMHYANTLEAEESKVDQFFHNLLHTLDFMHLGYQLHIRHRIHLRINGDRRLAQTDLGLWHAGKRIVLLLQENKSHASRRDDPVAQLVAEAIGAFQENNEARAAHPTAPELDTMFFPCFTAVGTRPAFYVIPVTIALSNAVVQGSYPRRPTFVLKCSIPGDVGADMSNPAYRVRAIQYMIAFRELARQLWRRLDIP